FSGNGNNPLIKTEMAYERGRINKAKLTGNILLTVSNHDSKPHTVLIADNSYKGLNQTKIIAPGATAVFSVNLSKNYNWYDHSVKVKGFNQFEERFAGRVETGAVTKTDPLMGRVV
ncbi:MAG TPA: phospholipase C, phosphocholine-specific, partial [Sphingobacteriaceae bacterium]|nr:phospholipase C, phosphocholine-specific [Sphingobacteriaceae bacterium]